MRPSLLALLPPVALALFLAPVLAGLAGTLAPAFGYLPALGGESLSLAPWRGLADTPGIGVSVRLSLTTGLAATAISLGLVFGFCAASYDRPVFARARRLLAPLVAVPHVAVAIGFAFLVTPSGWLVRLATAPLGGLDRPPDILVVQDPWGLALIVGLVLKEAPFLLLMTMGALGQAKSEATLTVARSLGYGPVQAWLKTVLPPLYRQLRLPIYAVLAYSLSVVDMALILGPGTPPTLAVQVFRWFRDPALSQQFVAAAGATLQLALVIGAIALWALGERVVARFGRPWLSAGGRGRRGGAARHATGLGLAIVFYTAVLSLASMVIWSFAWRWRFPDPLPGQWTLRNWTGQTGALVWPASVTLVIGLISALVALAIVVGLLENEQRRGRTAGPRARWLLFAPLIVPQVAFLFGIQVLLVVTRMDGTLVALVWAHLIFVLPYVYLALADPYRALDTRYANVGLVLGASPNRVFWRIKLPMLLRSVLLALAVGFAVSVAEYLPTIFAGGGRFATLTTETVSLAAGMDRRSTGVYAVVQAALPLLLFALALGLPAWRFRNRRMLQVAQ